MSWLTIGRAAKYACVRKDRLMELVDKGFLSTYPSLNTRFYGGKGRVLDTADLDSLIKRGRAPEGAREARAERSRIGA